MDIKKKIKKPISKQPISKQSISKQPIIPISSYPLRLSKPPIKKQISALDPSITIYIHMHSIEAIDKILKANTPHVIFFNSTGKLGYYNFGKFVEYKKEELFKKFFDDLRTNGKLSIYERNLILEEFLKKNLITGDNTYCNFPTLIRPEIFDTDIIPPEYSEQHAQSYRNLNPDTLQFRRKAIADKYYSVQITKKKLKKIPFNIYDGGIFILSTDNDTTIDPSIRDYLQSLLWNEEHRDNINLINETVFSRLEDFAHIQPKYEGYIDVLSNTLEKLKLYNNIKLSSLIQIFGNLGYKMINIIDSSCRSIGCRDETGKIIGCSTIPATIHLPDAEKYPLLRKTSENLLKMEKLREQQSMKEKYPDLDYSGRQYTNYGGKKTLKTKKSRTQNRKNKNRKTIKQKK